MQVTETVSDGLKREFKVVVPAADLASKADAKLDQLKDQVRINGFRPGKVPVAHLKRLYGRAVMAEMIETVVREANAQIVTERGFKLVREPQVTLPTEQGAVDQVIEGKSDLAYTMAVEILPTIELADFKGIQLERMNAEVTEAEVDEALAKISEQSRPFAAKGEGAKAESGDRVTIDFTGKMDGMPFQGGTGDDVTLHLGSGTFIPGFEDQLIGAAAGDQRTSQRDLSADLPVGASGRQERRIRCHREVDRVAAADHARRRIRQVARPGLARQAAGDGQGAAGQRARRMSRQKIKRKLLDELDAKHKFTPPPSLVEDEFANVWKTIVDDLQSRKRTFEDEGTTEEKARKNTAASPSGGCGSAS